MDTNDGYIDAAEKPSNSTNLSHTLTIIKAAFPYLDSQSQQTLNLVIKSGELIESFNEIQQEGPITALSIQKKTIDIEALLNGIRDVCNQKEREFIDMILNFYRAKNLYQTYSTLASVMASQSENTNETTDSESQNNSDNTGGIFGMGANPNMMEILETFLTPEQKSTFDNLSMMLSVMQ
jgi:hypothetical protein